MHKIPSFFFLLILILIFSCGYVYTQEGRKKDSKVNLREVLPVDSNITIGKLENGLTYYIRKNIKPEKRAELRLVVKAGSVYEDDDQIGLAHFVEHMAFNGTKNFPKQELINYLESIGMKFGPEINAYTSFEETVYMLQVPTDSTMMMEKGFNMLKDWAHNISFDNNEIDKERGVVIEEWRSGRGAEERMQNKQIPVLFKRSRFANRLPIGDKNNIEKFSYPVLKRFYNDWYRPDLMAVIAIGDFNTKEIEKLIKDHFSILQTTPGSRSRVVYPVPEHKETLFAVASDVEADMSRLAFVCKREVDKMNTIGDYKHNMIKGLFNAMLSGRIMELTKKADPPFMYGFSGKGRFTESLEAYFLGAGFIKDNKIDQCIETLLTEYNRVKKFGFTKTELEREKNKFSRNLEQIFLERNKIESSEYAGDCLNHFLQNAPLHGVEYGYYLSKKIIPEITLSEVNRMSDILFTYNNLVVMINVPEKERNKIPNEKELMISIKFVGGKEIKPYVDMVSNLPLLDKEPIPSKVLSVKEMKRIGSEEWTLGNGVKVVLKPTDFKNDEILFTAFSPGGTSQVTDKEYTSANNAVGIISQSGIGKFSEIEFQKLMAGKIALVSPWIDDYHEGFLGNCSPKDIETMFQLIYLYFTSPGKDSTGYLSYISQMKSMLQNRRVSPGEAFRDTIDVTMAQYHFRSRPMTLDILREINYQTALQFYKDRFADASDFMFFFVGNFETDKIKPLIEKYLGGLPSIKRVEKWKDLDINPPKGVINKIVRRGIEPKSEVQIVFSGPFEFNRQNRYEVEALKEILNINLREVIREEKSGTYGVSLWWSPELIPKPSYTFNIDFGCNPERFEELTKNVFEQIDSLIKFGPSENTLKKVKEIQKRTFETSVKENSFWLNALYSRYLYKEDPENIFTYPLLVNELSATAVQKKAQKYLDIKNYVRVVLFPEK